MISFVNLRPMRISIISFVCLWLVTGACNQPNSKLVVAAASSLKFAMEELTSGFTLETGIPCEAILSSSGKLAAQINEGAPYDVFLSADMKYPEHLYNNGLAISEPVIYAYGGLVLWSVVDGLQPSMDLLIDDQIAHIALANPKTAPYGYAAVQVLEQQGIYNDVRDKLVFGENISQTNQFIISKAAEIGFTSKSVVLSPTMSAVGMWNEIEPGLFTPIAHGIVVINKTDKLDQAKKFYDFIFSDQGRRILDKFGYSFNSN